jgi:hypothetical protein
VARYAEHGDGCSLANTHLYTNPDAHANLYTNSDPYPHRYAYANPHAHADIYADSHPYPFAHTDLHPNLDPSSGRPERHSQVDRDRPFPAALVRSRGTGHRLDGGGLNGHPVVSHGDWTLSDLPEIYFYAYDRSRL